MFKVDVLERGNYRGLKLTEHCLKVVERVMEKIACELVSVDEVQFGSVSFRETTNAIFTLWQFQEEHLTKENNLFLPS